MGSLSRRDFFKLGGLAFGGLALRNYLPVALPFEDIDLVRVAYHSVSVYEQPDHGSAIVRSWQRDDLIHVYETVEAAGPEFNPIWYRVFGGYMHRERLQKVRSLSNPVLDSLGGVRLPAEVTVPFTRPYRYTQWDGWTPVPFLMYYTTVHWLNAIDSGPDGQAWYRVLDEGDKNLEYFVPAADLRPIPPEETAPLSPEVPPDDKYIDVNLQIQTLFCYENDREVRRADVSSGLIGLYPTPTGRFTIQVKLPARDMRGSERFATDEENVLSGVPWTTFFTTEGHAFHGTYWHDNFGLPMSHGCINMRNEDALWLYRWTTPTSGHARVNQQTLDIKGQGTVIDIHF